MSGKPERNRVHISTHARKQWAERVGGYPDIETALSRSNPAASEDVFGKPLAYTRPDGRVMLLVLTHDTIHDGAEWVVRTVLYADDEGYNVDWDLVPDSKW